MSTCVECYVCKKAPAREGSFFCSRECGQQMIKERFPDTDTERARAFGEKFNEWMSPAARIILDDPLKKDIEKEIAEAREAAEGCGALFGLDRNTSSTGKGALVDLWANEIELTRQKILKDIEAARAQFLGEDKMNCKHCDKPMRSPLHKGGFCTWKCHDEHAVIQANSKREKPPEYVMCDMCCQDHESKSGRAYQLHESDGDVRHFCGYECLSEWVDGEGEEVESEPTILVPTTEAFARALHVSDPDVLEYACKVGEASKEVDGKKLPERGPKVIAAIEKMWARDEFGLKTKWLDMAERALAILKNK